MPAWVSTIPGRWVGPSNGIIEVTQNGDAKCFARWRGEKGGTAGFEGRLVDSGKTLNGHWFDHDAGVHDNDRLDVIAVAPDANTLELRFTQKDGAIQTWRIARAGVKRDGGTSKPPPRPRDGEATARLLQSTRHPEKMEALRNDVLMSAIRESLPGNYHSADGALLYIPPINVAEPFDERGPTRFFDSTRNRGRQIYGGLSIVGTSSGKALPFPYLPQPYMDATDVARAARLERERRAAALLSPGMRRRQGFRSASGHRPTSGVAFLSVVDAQHTTDAEMQRLRKLAAEQGSGWAEPPRRPASASARNTPTAKLVKASDGRLRVELARRPMLAGAKSGAWATQPAPHLPDEYDRRRRLDRQEAEREKAKRGPRPGFAPVGPRLVFETAPPPHMPEGAAPAKGPASRPQSAALPSLPAGYPNRPAYNPWSPSASRPPSATPYLPSEYMVFPNGGMGLMRSASSRSPSRRRPASAPSAAGGAALPPVAGVGAAGDGVGQVELAHSPTPWRPNAARSPTAHRLVKSVLLLPSNLHRFAATAAATGSGPSDFAFGISGKAISATGWAGSGESPSRVSKALPAAYSAAALPPPPSAQSRSSNGSASSAAAAAATRHVAASSAAAAPSVSTGFFLTS